MSQDLGGSVRAATAAACRALRAREGLTQAALAERLGLSRASVAWLEGGRRAASLEEVAALCSTFALSLWELLDVPEAEELRRALRVNRPPA